MQRRVFSPANRYLNDNELSGTIPSELSLFTIFTHLYERRCMFFPSPINRDLSDNSLNGTIPSSLFSWSLMTLMYEFNLVVSHKYLRDLSHNSLSGTIPSSLSLLTSLQSLFVLLCVFFFSPINRDLSDNLFTGTIPSSISLLAQLNSLYEFVFEVDSHD